MTMGEEGDRIAKNQTDSYWEGYEDMYEANGISYASLLKMAEADYKTQKVFEYYYDEDLSLAEIAEHTGISRQGVRDQIKHAEAQLLELENALHLYEKSKKTEEILYELSSVAKETNSEHLTSIVEKLRKIYE